MALTPQQQAIAISLYREGKGPQVISTFLGVSLSIVQSFLQFNLKNSKDASTEGRRANLDGALPTAISNVGLAANILGIVKAVSGTGTLAQVTVQPVNGTSSPTGATFVGQGNDMYAVAPTNLSGPATDASGRNFGVGSKVV